MSNVRRSIAQLRAERDARLQRIEEGIALRQEARQERSDYLKAAASDQILLAEKTLVKATRACALLEDASFGDWGFAYESKACIHKDLGHIKEALANFREARQMFVLAEDKTVLRGSARIVEAVRCPHTFRSRDEVEAQYTFPRSAGGCVGGSRRVGAGASMR